MSARRCLRCGGDPRYLPPDFACAHQLPPYVLRLLAIGVPDEQVRARIPSWQPGRLLAAYDPAAGVDSIVLTANPAEAMQFAEVREALDLWRAVDPNDPIRPDGKPNRPLTAWTVEPVVMPPGGCFHHDPHPVRRGGPLLCQTCGQLEHPRLCYDQADGTLACCCGLEDGLLREADRIGEALADQEARQAMTANENADSVRLCRDVDCPECGWPETYAEVDFTKPTPGADALGCNNCGWRVLAGQEAQP